MRSVNLKIIASVCVLLLIIGFVNTARLKQQTANANEITAEILRDHPRAIDSSFFDYNVKPTSVVIPATAEPSPVTPPKPASPATNPNPQPQSLSDIITADSYLVGNLATGKIYFEKDPTVTRPIASISKLITAMVVEEKFDPAKEVAIASSSATGYEQNGDVAPGEIFAAKDLLAGMLLISSNDAATAFADDYGYPAFVSFMNQNAQLLGMTKTSFVDPSGLSSGDFSSANDLFTLARYMYTHEPGILSVTKMPEFELASTTEHAGHLFVNIDPFAYDPHYIGGKTGRTDAAGETMLSLFNLPIDGVDNPIAIIVLHSDQDARQTDSSTLVGKVLNLISSR